jgi:magnesium chelatase subunit D
MIELGYLSCQHELQAGVYRASSVLDSRVRESLGRAPGRATPLAHALDLAIQELHRQLRHHKVAAENSWLVVVSDGRGNVPLQVSQRLRFDGVVSTEGVADALAVAKAARSLPSMHRVVLPPPHLTHYTSLPFELADALGGVVAEPT